MARASGAWRFLCAAAIAVALAACAKQDGSVLLGQWRAERFDVQGLKLPIGPDLAITRNKLSTGGDDLGVAVTALEQDGDEVVLNVSGDIGLTFHMVDADRMYFKIPFMPVLDRIYYRRVNSVTVAAPAVAVAAAPTGANPTAVGPATVAAEAPVYALAVQAARQGRGDAALRYLHQAVQLGFDRGDLVRQEAAFAALRSDPRYQVIVSRMPAN